ncbi:hypothetical protein F5Y16DRAFT_413312 [Xylariaceae sp. FL0255]|nr:hypothetical protein F5Y16DRAFT_413312 [Xylariaceae sp. FL0255]
MSRYAEAFKKENLAGPGDARPTALQIIKDEEREMTMKDKVFLITGSGSGIGIETTRALAATGARVYGLVRNVDAAREACTEFLERGRVELLECDLSSMASVRAAAETFKAKSTQLNVLVANAAVMSIPKRELSVDGFEMHFATNYLGHFLLFYLLKDLMVASATPEFASRVVQVSSASHHVSEINFDDINWNESYDPKTAYAQSKLAQIYLANYIERHFTGVHALSLMPGGIRTNILRYTPTAVVEKIMSSSEFLQKWYKSPAQGAATTVLAAVGRKLEGQGGIYLEDCAVAKVEGQEGAVIIPSIKGVKACAFDVEKQEKLWAATVEMLKLDA